MRRRWTSGSTAISPVDEQEGKTEAQPVGEPDNSASRMLGCANSIAAVSGVIWLLLFLRAADHYREVAKFGYPDLTGAWDFWVYLPLGLTIGTLLLALAANFLFRSAVAPLIVFSVIALAAVLPYLVWTSGGI
jgi:hypothetical protein